MPQGHLLCKVQEWLCDSQVILYEVVVVPSKSQKGPDIHDCLWGWPVLYDLYLGRVYPDHPPTDNNPKEVDLMLLEETFFWLEVEIVSLQYVEDLVHQPLVAGQVLLFCLEGELLGVDHSVVHID